MAKTPEALYEQKERTTFWCPSCRHRFESEVERTADCSDPACPHPFDYFATCPECGAEAPESPQVRALYRAWLNITGTKSPEKSAENLQKVDPNRSRFNAMKHGLYAKKARYFPGDPGRYPECDGCGFAEECQASGVCLEVSKVRMMVQHAIDSRDPRALADLARETQADLFVLLRRMFQEVLADGVQLKAPVWSGTKHGYELVRDAEGNQVVEHSDHPLLKRIIEMVAKNNLSLADLLLTPKTAEENEALRGHLDGEKESRQDLRDYRQDRNKMLEQFLSGQASLDAAKRRGEDPVAKEAMREIESGREAEEEGDLGMEEFPGLPGGAE